MSAKKTPAPAQIEPANAESPQDELQSAQGRVESAKFVSIYANQFETGASAFDIQISCAQLRAISGEPMIEDLASLIMPPQVAKALLVNLLETLIAYENHHGTIKLAYPNNVLPMTQIIVNIGEYLKTQDAEAVKAQEVSNASDAPS